MNTFFLDTESFCIGSPKHQHLVQVVVLLEVPNVLADCVEVL